MSTAKEELTRLIENQPDSSSREEIVREVMAEIRWTEEAERWLNDIYEYIAADNPSAAARTVHTRA